MNWSTQSATVGYCSCSNAVVLPHIPGWVQRSKPNINRDGHDQPIDISTYQVKPFGTAIPTKIPNNSMAGFNTCRPKTCHHTRSYASHSTEILSTRVRTLCILCYCASQLFSCALMFLVPLDSLETFGQWMGTLG